MFCTVRKKNLARDGDRTHAHYCELDLKSNALTTRPPWHGIQYTGLICRYVLAYLIVQKVIILHILTQQAKRLARNGNRTHAHHCELNPKSNAITTRPPWPDDW